MYPIWVKNNFLLKDEVILFWRKQVAVERIDEVQRCFKCVLPQMCKNE